MLPISFPTGGTSAFPRVCACAKCAGLSADALDHLSPDKLPPAAAAAFAELPPVMANNLLEAIATRAAAPALPAPAPEPAMVTVPGTINPTTSGAPTGNIYIDSLIWGGSWAPSLGTGVTLTWAPVTSANVALGGGNANGLTPRDYELEAIREGLALWSDVANITFVEMPLNTPGTDLSYMIVSNFQMLLLTVIPGVLGFHQVPDGSDPGPLTGVFNRGGVGFNEPGLEQGGFGFITVVHEIGHGLGLAHPHDGGGDGQVYPGVSSNSDPGDNNLNQGVWTTMSYVDGWETQYPTHSDRSYGWQGGPMSFDIAAIQTIYGANTTTRTGDDLYALPTVNGPGAYFLSIWDAGGIDTLSAAGATGAATIDLRAAPLTGPDAGGYVSFVQGIVGGRTIANGVLVENATGGNGNDTITGNDAANLIDGGAGVDSMAGGLGDDTYVVNIAGDVVVEAAGGGIDTILSAVTRTLGAEIENLTLTGAAAINGTGNALANRLEGNGAANRLVGGEGADTLTGGLGADSLTGGAGADQFLFNLLTTGFAAADRVLDFNVGFDRIVLDSTVFTALGGPGALDAEALAIGSAPTEADDRLVYNSSAGWLGYDPDGSGSGTGFIVANLGANKALTAANFLIA